MTRIALCQMPFQSVRRPSLGLSLLREILEQNGHTVEMRFPNVEFARRIGVHLYTTISEGLPASVLFGDVVFAPVWLDPSAADRTPASEEIARYASWRPIPMWLCDALPALVEQARDLVRAEGEALARAGFDLVGFNTTFNLAPGLSMARFVKAVSPETRTVLGGASCEGVMGAAVIRLFDYVDYVCPGEGETALLNLARAIAAGDERASIPGILSRSHPVRARPVPPQNLDALPVPRYDDWLAEIGRAGLDIRASDLLIPIETSRGCWYGAQQHCTFCGLNGENMRFRSKSEDRVMREIDAALSYGIRSIQAVDNILDFRYFKTVLPELARRHIPGRLFYEIKSKVTRDQVELMRQAGIRDVQPGIESLSTPVLKLMRKGVQAYHNIRLLKWGEELGIAMTWNLLYGFPGERKQDYLDMIEMLPLLFHLQPPDAGRIHLDRFSPLHFDGTALGVASRRPVPPYQVVYGLPEHELEDLAYYFAFEPVEPNDPDEYGDTLTSVVNDWKKSHADSALVRIELADGACQVFDTRPCGRVPRGSLDPAELDVVRRSDRGIRLGELLAGAADAGRAAAAVSRLLGLGWLLAVDGRVLSLIADYTGIVPRSVPPGLAEAYCLAAAATRHRAVCAADQDEHADMAQAQALRDRSEGTDR